MNGIGDGMICGGILALILKPYFKTVIHNFTMQKMLNLGNFISYHNVIKLQILFIIPSFCFLTTLVKNVGISELRWNTS